MYIKKMKELRMLSLFCHFLTLIILNHFLCSHCSFNDFILYKCYISYPVWLIYQKITLFLIKPYTRNLCSRHAIPIHFLMRSVCNLDQNFFFFFKKKHSFTDLLNITAVKKITAQEFMVPTDVFKRTKIQNFIPSLHKMFL